MEQEIYDVAEMLAACFKDAPVTLTILPRVNAYNVRTQAVIAFGPTIYPRAAIRICSAP